MLSMSQLAIALGYIDKDASKDDLRREARKLRTVLNRLEHGTGKTFLHRFGQGKNATIKTTIVALRKHCPDLFEHRDELLETLKEWRDQLHDDVDELKQQLMRETTTIKSRLTRIEQADRSNRS
jgi:hypothetical protein